MKVRLFAKHSLLVGLVASLSSVGGFGCADETSKSSLDPAGPPRVLQVYVLDPDSSDDPVGGEYALTYGIHPDAWRCTVVDRGCDNGEPEDNPDCFDSETSNDSGCLTCAASGDFEDHCVYSEQTTGLGGTSPTSTAATATGSSIRIISKELLDGQTLEQFACFCYGTMNEDESDPCPAGGDWVINPRDCSACGDNVETPINEAGRCLDLNNDQIPDLATLQAGVATITCDGVAGFGANGVYTTEQGDGYYNPSGNQLVTSGFGYGGLGPAIVIEPHLELPTGTECTIQVTNKVLDKDGNAFSDNVVASFETETMHPAVAPSGTMVAVTTRKFTISFPVTIKASSINNSAVQIRKMGGTFITGTTVAPAINDDDEMDPTAVDLILPSGTNLDPTAMYEIVIDASLTDTYGMPADASTIKFTTAAAPAPPT